MSPLFHVTSAANRESIRSHGLDWTRMGAARGIAGSMTPALEIMINTPTVKKLIEENRLDKLPAAIETGSDDGMINFNQALFNLVKDGKVSEQEALAKASNPSLASPTT